MFNVEFYMLVNSIMNNMLSDVFFSFQFFGRFGIVLLNILNSFYVYNILPTYNVVDDILTIFHVFLTLWLILDFGRFCLIFDAQSAWKQL